MQNNDIRTSSLHLLYPLCFSVSDYINPLLRTLGVRKAFDEPLDASIRHAEGEFLAGLQQHAPQQPTQQVVHDDETPMNLEIKRVETKQSPCPPSPPPPQDEPVDFSTKPAAPAAASAAEHEKTEEKSLPPPVSFTSTRELKFARNLKLLLVEIFRSHPLQARIIIDYLRSVSRVMRKSASPTEAGGGIGGGGGIGVGGVLSSANTPGDGGGNGGSSSSADSGGGFGTGSPGSDSSYAGSGGGGGGGSGSSGGGVTNNNNNNDLDLDCLDFSGLHGEHSHTAKWFSEHPDINPAKVFEGLLTVKTEFPYPIEAAKVEKPPDLSSLDSATANLLQMSVPDPSTTFLDIGTDSSMYEDDPFKIENLLPANFNVGQLDVMTAAAAAAAVSAANPPSSQHHHPAQQPPQSQHQHEGPQHLKIQQQQQRLHFPHHSQHSAAAAAAAAAIGMSLYPETTISAVNGTGQQVKVKSEPLTFIKQEEQLVVHQPRGAPTQNFDNHDTSSLLSSGSVGSPGSPPGVPFAGLTPPGGGKMRTTTTGHTRKKAAPMTQEEDELSSVPSLQMRIKILQQRVSTDES